MIVISIILILILGKRSGYRNTHTIGYTVTERTRNTLNKRSETAQAIARYTPVVANERTTENNTNLHANTSYLTETINPSNLSNQESYSNNSASNVTLLESSSNTSTSNVLPPISSSNTSTSNDSFSVKNVTNVGIANVLSPVGSLNASLSNVSSPGSYSNTSDASASAPTTYSNKSASNVSPSSSPANLSTSDVAPPVYYMNASTSSNGSPAVIYINASHPTYYSDTPPIINVPSLSNTSAPIISTPKDYSNTSVSNASPTKDYPNTTTSNVSSEKDLSNTSSSDLSTPKQYTNASDTEDASNATVTVKLKQLLKALNKTILTNTSSLQDNLASPPELRNTSNVLNVTNNSNTSLSSTPERTNSVTRSVISSLNKTTSANSTRNTKVNGTSNFEAISSYVGFVKDIIDGTDHPSNALTSGVTKSAINSLRETSSLHDNTTLNSTAKFEVLNSYIGFVKAVINETDHSNSSLLNMNSTLGVTKSVINTVNETLGEVTSPTSIRNISYMIDALKSTDHTNSSFANKSNTTIGGNINMSSNNSSLGDNDTANVTDSSSVICNDTSNGCTRGILNAFLINAMGGTDSSNTSQNIDENQASNAGTRSEFDTKNKTYEKPKPFSLPGDKSSLNVSNESFNHSYISLNTSAVNEDNNTVVGTKYGLKFNLNLTNLSNLSNATILPNETKERNDMLKDALLVIDRAQDSLSYAESVLESATKNNTLVEEGTNASLVLTKNNASTQMPQRENTSIAGTPRNTSIAGTSSNASLIHMNGNDSFLTGSTTDNVSLSAASEDKPSMVDKKVNALLVETTNNASVIEEKHKALLVETKDLASLVGSRENASTTEPSDESHDNTTTPLVDESMAKVVKLINNLTDSNWAAYRLDTPFSDETLIGIAKLINNLNAMNWTEHSNTSSDDSRNNTDSNTNTTENNLLSAADLNDTLLDRFANFGSVNDTLLMKMRDYFQAMNLTSNPNIEKFGIAVNDSLRDRIKSYLAAMNSTGYPNISMAKASPLVETVKKYPKISGLVERGRGYLQEKLGATISDDQVAKLINSFINWRDHSEYHHCLNDILNVKEVNDCFENLYVCNRSNSTRRNVITKIRKFFSCKDRNKLRNVIVIGNYTMNPRPQVISNNTESQSNIKVEQYGANNKRCHKKLRKGDDDEESLGDKACHISDTELTDENELFKSGGKLSGGRKCEKSEGRLTNEKICDDMQGGLTNEKHTKESEAALRNGTNSQGKPFENWMFDSSSCDDAVNALEKCQFDIMQSANRSLHGSDKQAEVTSSLGDDECNKEVDALERCILDNKTIGTDNECIYNAIKVHKCKLKASLRSKMSNETLNDTISECKNNEDLLEKCKVNNEVTPINKTVEAGGGCDDTHTKLARCKLKLKFSKVISSLCDEYADAFEKCKLKGKNESLVSLETCNDAVNALKNCKTQNRESPNEYEKKCVKEINALERCMKNHVSQDTFSGSIQKSDRVNNTITIDGARNETTLNETSDFEIGNASYIMRNLTTFKECQGCLRNKSKGGDTFLNFNPEDEAPLKSNVTNTTGDPERFFKKYVVKSENPRCQLPNTLAMSTSQDDDDLNTVREECYGIVTKRRLISNHIKTKNTKTSSDGTVKQKTNEGTKVTDDKDTKTAKHVHDDMNDDEMPNGDNEVEKEGSNHKVKENKSKDKSYWLGGDPDVTKNNSKATPANKTSTKSTKEVLKRILCFGDSITKGYYANGKKYHPYSIKLEALLREDGINVDVLTHGINGECASLEMQKRLARDLEELPKLNLVIILGGTNDLLSMDCVRKVDLFQEIKNLHLLVRAKGYKSVVVTVPESKMTVDGTEKMSLLEYKEELDETNQKMRMYAVAAKLSLIDLADDFSRHTMPGKTNISSLWDDDVHPSREGYDRIGEIIYEQIKSLFL